MFAQSGPGWDLPRSASIGSSAERRRWTSAGARRSPGTLFAEMPAIRIKGIGKYFGPRLEIDGAERPREAWRALMGIAGVDLKPAADDEIQRTVAVAGHVLRDVTLDIEKGSVVCLTGPSGSGKSVLLSILAGVTGPTT